MKNNKKLIAIVVAIVLALIGLIVFIMKDSIQRLEQPFKSLKPYFPRDNLPSPKFKFQKPINKYKIDYQEGMICFENHI